MKNLLSFEFPLKGRIVLLLSNRAIEEILISHCSSTQNMHVVNLADTIQNVIP